MSAMASGQTVSLQAALSDSTFLNLRLTCKGDGERTLTLTAAYLTRRGNMATRPTCCASASWASASSVSDDASKKSAKKLGG